MNLKKLARSGLSGVLTLAGTLLVSMGNALSGTDRELITIEAKTKKAYENDSIIAATKLYRRLMLQSGADRDIKECLDEVNMMARRLNWVRKSKGGYRTKPPERIWRGW